MEALWKIGTKMSFLRMILYILVLVPILLLLKKIKKTMVKYT